MTDIAFEQNHPRGEAGKFAAKEGTAPDVGLEGIIGFKGSPDSPSVQDLQAGESFDLGYGRADDEETERILRWVEAEGVSGKATYAGFGKHNRPDGSPSEYNTHNYAVTLTTDDGREFSVDFHMGSALGAPTTTDVLQAVASDAHSFSEYDKQEYMEEFGGYREYGIDPDDTTSGDAMYEAVQEQTDNFREFAGDDYDFLLYGE